jgi:hypothetical protein
MGAGAALRRPGPRSREPYIVWDGRDTKGGAQRSPAQAVLRR